MQEILVVGHVCIDSNKTEHASYVGAGSPAMFMERIFRQLPDCRLTIAAPYGKDFVTYAQGISFYPAEPQGPLTMRYENTISKGARIQHCMYWEGTNPVPIDRKLVEILQTADTICLAPLAPTITP